MTDQALSHVFDDLRIWKQQCGAGSAPHWTSDLAEKVEDITELLFAADQQPIVTHGRSFEKFVHEASDLLERYSKALGRAIIEANRLSDSGDTEAACMVYQNFIADCHAPFYRQIAQSQIRKLNDQA